MSLPLLPGAEPAIDPVLVERARAEMSADGVPGVALGVCHRGRTATAGLGVTNVRHPQPVTGETLFQIGSITKTFTATAILQLVEQGRIELGDPIRAHLPGFAVADPEVSQSATIRDCLTHSTGWHGDVFIDTGWGDDALATILERMAGLGQVTPPGRIWSYNNAAFYPLGRILEVVHGRPYEAVIEEMVLRPLGMDSACFFAHDLLHRSFAVGHAGAGEDTVIARPWAMPRSSNPVGGLAASAEELMRYTRFLLDGTPAGLLSDTMRRSAYEPAGPAGDRPAIGLGWWLEDAGGGREVSHGGGANGQPCLLAMLPSEQFALVILTNGAGGRTTGQRLLSWAKRHYFDIEEPLPQPDEAVESERWHGSYESYLDRWVIRAGDDGPVLDWIPLGDWLEDQYPPDSPRLGAPVVPLSPHTMMIDPGARLPGRAELIDDEAGDLRWLRLGLRANERRRPHR